jgi:hypothetical protein
LADETIARALADCLEGLRAGDDALAASLARFPDMRSELEELLRLVDVIPMLPPDLTADPVFVERTRAWLGALPPGPFDSGSFFAPA